MSDTFLIDWFFIAIDPCEAGREPVLNDHRVENAETLGVMCYREIAALAENIHGKPSYQTCRAS
jgi:hypothetical protein